MTELPTTIEELATYIAENAENIYVREMEENTIHADPDATTKWGNYALTELTQQAAIRHAARFMAEGRIPVVLKEPSEEEE